MVEERVTDGRRIAELLASEVTGREGELADLAVVDADREVEPTPDGARAYEVVLEGGPRAGMSGGEEDGGPPDERPLAVVFVQPDRVRIEITVAPDAALAAAEERDLRARPRATTPPAAVVFVETGAETKRAADVLGAAASAHDADGAD